MSFVAELAESTGIDTLGFTDASKYKIDNEIHGFRYQFYLKNADS